MLRRARRLWSKVRSHPSRADILLRHIDTRAPGLEIGPSHRPTVTKRGGGNVQILDHLPAEGLREKYREHGVDIAAIEDVDYVWKGERFRELVGAGVTFDWIIASHVIEHTPSLVDFLDQCTEILSPAGVLSLAVPDKRFCFDRFRERSSLARVLDAHHAGTRITSPGTAADFLLNVVSKGGAIAWDRHQTGAYAFVHGLEEAKRVEADILANATYHDLHSWCFTPHSFRLLMEDLNALGYTELREAYFHPTVGSEFFCCLSRQGSGPGMTRMALLRAMVGDDAAAARL